MYRGPALRYCLIQGLGVALALWSVQYMPEPEFVKEGQTIKHHVQLLTIIIGCGAVTIYWLFNRQREKIYRLDERFASIGRQSTFLLHELKSPLSRFMMSNSEKDNRDAEYILSIVEGVELLVAKKENLAFTEFEWPAIRNYLLHEFTETCRHYDINLQIDGFEGTGFGHRSTIKLALKNLTKNAVEAIALAGTKGSIRISRKGNAIEVSNNGSVINKEQIENLFKPFYSGKNSKTNHGIGLHFVESVVKAHNGSIGVRLEDGWNIFQLHIGEKV